MKKFNKIKKEIDLKENKLIEEEVENKTNETSNFFEIERNKTKLELITGETFIIDYPVKVPFINIKDFTPFENELSYGIKRNLNKIKIYTEDYTFEEFINDDLVFDGSMYCLIEIERLTKLLYFDPKILNYYNTVDFSFLENIYKKGIKDDNLNLSYLYDACHYLVPYVLTLMYQIEGVIEKII